MNKIYCMNCGSPTSEMFAKFCPSCGKPLVASTNTSSKPVKKAPLVVNTSEEEDFNEDTDTNSIPNITKLQVELDEQNSGLSREPLSNLAKAQKTGFTRDVPEDIKKMNKKQLKKHMLDEFGREASNKKRGV